MLKLEDTISDIEYEIANIRDDIAEAATYGLDKACVRTHLDEIEESVQDAHKALDAPETPEQKLAAIQKLIDEADGYDLALEEVEEIINA